jgi:hypothetical protein
VTLSKRSIVPPYNCSKLCSRVTKCSSLALPCLCTRYVDEISSVLTTMNSAWDDETYFQVSYWYLIKRPTAVVDGRHVLSIMRLISRYTSCVLINCGMRGTFRVILKKWVIFCHLSCKPTVCIKRLILESECLLESWIITTLFLTIHVGTFVFVNPI